MTESLVLAAAGGALGLLVANWALDLLVSVAPDNLPRLDEVTLDSHIALFTFAATIAVGVLFGLAPAMQASRPELNSDLKDGGRAGSARTGVRNVMVVTRSPWRSCCSLAPADADQLLAAARRRSGISHQRVSITVELMLPLARYNEEAQRRFYMGVLERLQSDAAAQSAMLFPFPFGGGTRRRHST